jgi:hypothetical protein
MTAEIRVVLAQRKRFRAVKDRGGAVGEHDSAEIK